jgi:hypothetical protein
MATRSHLAALATAVLLAACGGSVTNAADAGVDRGDGAASETDSGEDASACPPGSKVPDADVYLCQAAPAGSAGCQASVGDPRAIYPEGCMMLLPHPGGFCAGPCCGPLECVCQRTPGFDDGGLEFICPD